MLDGGPSRAPQPIDRRAPRRSEVSRRYSESQQPAEEPKTVNHPAPAKPPKAATTRKKSTNRFIKPIMVILVALILGVAGWLAWSNMRSDIGAAIDESKYQAVFFTNGQVYFGKLEVAGSDYMKLTDVFYIQSDTSADGISEEGSTEPTTEQKLIKRGAEVYGPEDPMVIDRDQVMFFENLKTDSEVVQLIRNYQSGNN